MKKLLLIGTVLFSVCGWSQYIRPNQVSPGAFQRGTYTFTGTGTTTYALTAKESSTGNTVSILTTDSTDRQVTQNYYAPDDDRRINVSFWSKPFGHAGSQRMFSISTHGRNDQYNAGLCDGVGCNHVTFYSNALGDDSGKVLEWQWGSQWNSKLTFYVRDFEFNKEYDDSANQIMQTWCGGTHECQWIWSRTTSPTTAVQEWKLRIQPNLAAGWFDQALNQYRIEWMLSGDNIYNVATGKAHYFRVNGSNVGTLDVNGLSIPKLLGITDTAVVTNLNSDTVDGVHVGNKSNGKGVCWKDATHLGYCSTAIDASGNCTCN